jgi:hypothetical protein
MTGNPGDAGYDPNTQGVPVNIVAGGSGGGSGGAVSLLSTDPGLVALAMALAGVTPHTLADLYTLQSSTGIKVATLPTITGTVAVTNIDTSINTLFTSTGIKVTTLPDAANAVLTAVKDQTGTYTHWIGVKSEVLQAIEDQRVHYIATAPAVTSATLQSAQTSTGVGTAFTVTGMKMVAIQVTSTVVGTITYDFEVSVDGANFMTGIDAVDMLGADNLGSITQTGAGTWIYQIMCAGITKIQCNITANAATGGTSVTVTGQAVA